MKKTYLYIKIHNKTGLRYFGKTVQDPFKYPGSGKYWKRHLQLHGNDVKTEIVGCFNDPVTLEKTAKMFSEVHQIVESPIWANLKPENGLDGGREKGCYNPMKWTKSACIMEAEKYTRMIDFQKYSGSAYNSARNNGWLDDITKNYDNGYVKWTKPQIKKVVQKVSTLSELRDNYSSCYQAILKNNYDELLDPIRTKKRKRTWTFCSAWRESQKYNSRSEFNKKASGAYRFAKENDLLDLFYMV